MAADGSFLLADVLDVLDGGRAGRAQRVKRTNVSQLSLKDGNAGDSATKVL